MSTKADVPSETKGAFVREQSQFRQVIIDDPASKFPAEKGRYVLYGSPGCPWAHRAFITRKLKGLSDIIEAYYVHMFMGPEGWYFSGELGSEAQDPIHGFKTLKQFYLKADPSYTGKITVPIVWDKKTETIVSNESSEIIRMFNSAFDRLLDEGREGPKIDLYPIELRADIDALNEWVYNKVNNGVYKVVFATAQEPYDENIYPLFDALDRLEDRLGHGKPFLFGEQITEADIRLFTTAIRFDLGYAPIAVANLKSIRHDYPRLYLWLRRLYWDQSSRTNGAFYATTQPWIHVFMEGFARARHQVVTPTAPILIPRGPLTLIDELSEGEKVF